VRHLSGLAATGSGLIHFTLVSQSPCAVGVILAIIGVVEFGWGILVMFDERFMHTRVVAIAAIVPLAAWLVLLAANASPAAFPLAIASGLELFVAITAATQGRGRIKQPSNRPAAAGVLVVGVVAIALLTGVAIVTAGVPTVTDDWILYPHNH
jgi:uncharacterized membrane protein